MLCDLKEKKNKCINPRQEDKNKNTPLSNQLAKSKQNKIKLSKCNNEYESDK